MSDAKRSRKKYFQNFWKYRFLLKEIVNKNVKLQYRNSVLGMFWTFLQPLLTTIVLILIFGRLFNRGGGPGEYPMYLLCGRLLYEFFTQSTKRGMRSIRNSASVIKKVYVPKYIYPLSNVISSFITFCISLIVLVAVMLYFIIRYQGETAIHFSWNMLLSVVPVGVLLVLCLGVGLLLSVLDVYFKDIEYIYDVFTMLLFYATPILYKVDQMSFSPIVAKVIEANPLYSVISMFRYFIIGGTWDWNWLIYSSIFSAVLFVISVFIFYKAQDKFILHI